METRNKKDLIILGAGGYAHQLYWIAQRCREYSVLGMLDETIPKGEERYYHETLISSDFSSLLKRNSDPLLVCAVGDIPTRKRWVYQYGNEYEFASIIDPSSIIAPDASIGKNVVILGATICSVECVIEDHVNINWQCLISHHVLIGEYTNISSGVKLTGSVTVGHSCDIGTSANIIPNKRIGNGVVLGAGAVVTKNIPPHTTAVGAPARVIKQHKGTEKGSF